MSKFDKILWILLASVMIAILAVTVYVIPRENERHQRAEGIAQKMGCENLGSARDLPGVKFLDCDGEIRVIRVR